MTSSIPLFRFTSPAALVAASFLVACGGGGGGATNDSSAESMEVAEAALLSPLTSDAVPAPGGDAAPEPLEREQPSTVSCAAPIYARPRTAALDMSRD
jgi:hypothetical protein